MVTTVSFTLKVYIQEVWFREKKLGIFSKGTLSKCSQENVHFIFLIMEIFRPSKKADWIVWPSLETLRLFLVKEY